MSRSWKSWLDQFNLTSVKLNLKFIELEFNPQPSDRAAAWDLYIELLTRTATQSLPSDAGDEEAALKSVYSIFETTRAVLKSHGTECVVFSKIAIPVLNQTIRPFTSKWHKLLLSGAFEDPTAQASFRSELELLQNELRIYTKMLADLAGVEDLTDLTN